MKRFVACFVVVMGLFLAGCPATETDAVRTLAGTKGFIEGEMHQHGECTTTTSNVCTLIKQAVDGQHVAVLALDAYCSSNDYLTNGGKCLPPTDPAAKKELAAKLTTAISNLDPIVKSLKSIAGGGQ